MEIAGPPGSKIFLKKSNKVHPLKTVPFPVTIA